MGFVKVNGYDHQMGNPYAAKMQRIFHAGTSPDAWWNHDREFTKFYREVVTVVHALVHCLRSSKYSVDCYFLMHPAASYHSSSEKRSAVQIV